MHKRLSTQGKLRIIVVFRQDKRAFLSRCLDKRRKIYYTYYVFKKLIRSRKRRETVYEESPSVSETGCRRNPGGGDFKESATENYRLGKSLGKDEKAR